MREGKFGESMVFVLFFILLYLEIDTMLASIPYIFA